MSVLNKRSLTVSVDGTERYAEVSKATINSAAAPTDFVTYADAAAGGGRVYALTFTLAQDAASGSLWSEIWSNAGTTVAVLVRPYGNSVASVTQPHFLCSALISEPDGVFLGGEADASVTAKQVVEVEWALTGKPTKVTS